LREVKVVTPDQIKELADLLAVPFYRDPAFWIGTVIGLLGLWFSIWAYIEAKRAKLAAKDAGRIVKIQTITIELTEIAQRLDKLDFDLEFTTARDLLNEVTRRLRRLIAPFQSNEKYAECCQALKKSLDDAKLALDESRPSGPESERAPNTIYYGIQGHFATISSGVAEITGLFEAETIENPNEHRN
jgi:hypothetical protein